MENKPNDNRADNLPPNATEFIRQVVRRMRWRRRVRQDVQTELTAHFEDALTDCATGEEKDRKAHELIREFGDAKLLAVLCRRAKKRCRPLWVRVSARMLQAMGLFVLLFTPYTIWFVRGKPEPTIDYYSQLNALYPADDRVEDNAWSYYERAMRLIVEPNDALKRAPWFESLGRGGEAPTPPEQKSLMDWMAMNRLAWLQFEFAAAKGHCNRTYRRLPGKPLVINSIDDPPLMTLRRLHQLGRWKSRLAAEQGHTDEAFDYNLTLIRAGAHLQRNVFMIEQLVAWAFGGTACEEILRILRSTDLTETQLSNLQTRLAKICQDRCAHVNVEGERLMVLDGIQYEFTNGGIGGGHHVAGAYTRGVYAALRIPEIPENRRLRMVLMPIDIGASMFHAGRTRTITKVNQVYDRMSEIVRRSPYDRREHGIGGIMDDVGRAEKLRYGIVYLLLPAERRVSEIRFQAKADHEALGTVLAIKRYRLDTGRYPRDLKTVVEAGYLKELPMDPFSDQPLVYKLTAESFLLYSVGRDFHDDGGEPGKDKEGKPKMWADKGDTVFWPVP